MTALTVPWGYVMILDDQPVSMRVRNDAPHLVALDIDGTLLVTGQRVPEPTVLAVQLVRSRKHHVVLASGRSLTGILPVAKELGITDGWVVASNGAVTARLCDTCANGYMLEDVLTFDVGPVAQMALSRFPDVQIGVEEIGVGYRVNRTFAPHEVNGAQRVVPVGGLGVLPASRAILRGPDVLDLLEPLRRHGVTATQAGPDWIDVTPRHLSKATSLETIRATLGVPQLNTFAVGDGLNDIEMLSWAARAVAMGHAPEAVKAIAHETVGDISQHGVIQALKTLI
ncbi:HAD family hydrolase [Promicromonospora iranensis]|uniref:Hydroxymethylpyrimidine pyrophosphatase-like HAD family hydrolase n=1 Tax=Promicromonospora iranensis TaxID=1105144 RepID=A0ABU2CP81_9MICO|nr:HAD family hydrolase [Promicromonospora iranensis]MDR7383086.1 hydroxymethylpyrimidine pyrophosphatase-like HAD family hydrolase [Promicromonospora iranensis]